MPKTPPDRAIIALLNEVLTGELTAINQYFCHAKMCANWGFTRLANKIRHESIDEMKHAEALIDRVLYLGGVPNLQRLGKINIGETVAEQLTVDLALEHEALPRLNAGIVTCRDAGDNGTRALLEEILRSEEEHVDWLEAQLELIDQVGLQNYLAQQMHEA
ncbi:MAG: bacterioferritin [Deltaproteobacteria bacterium HGW-Deltaproteobacteria-14]|nr:MAG: bacterioferritin [Deltaproteobacteria bacterium HGW-Deltaproteobacteria-14]